MSAPLLRPIILCEECDCEAVQFRSGPPGRRIVQCRDCGLELGSWEDWLHRIEERVRAQETPPPSPWFAPHPIVH